MSYYNEFVQRAKEVEKEFTDKYLSEVVKATKEQDIYEHWDVQGKFKGQIYRFDIKDMKKFNRKDIETQDEMACVEYVNVSGYPGWVQGQSNYIVFKRKNGWLLVNREELWDMLKTKLEERNYSPTDREWFEPKEPYATYDRSFFGKKDKFCWVPFEDLEKLKDIHKLEHVAA